jgi:hypothetical protein
MISKHSVLTRGENYGRYCEDFVVELATERFTFGRTILKLRNSKRIKSKQPRHASESIF